MFLGIGEVGHILGKAAEGFLGEESSLLEGVGRRVFVYCFLLSIPVLLFTFSYCSLVACELSGIFH